MNYEITLEESPSGEELRILKDGLTGHGNAIFGSTSVKNVTFFLRDSAGTIVGGVHGNYGSFGWLYIDTLWVSEALRGGGHGTHLMKLIEDQAMAAGCTKAYLSTFSFQAPEFYKKLGYTAFGELEDFPDGHSRFFLRKGLSGDG